MSKQKAAKDAAVLELSCVQHKLCQSMSFDAALLMVREAPWLSWKVNLCLSISSSEQTHIWGEITEYCWS